MQGSNTFPAGMSLFLFVVMNALVINLIVFTTFHRYSGQLYEAVRGRELTRFALVNLAQLGMLFFSAYLAYKVFHSNGDRIWAWALAVLLTLIVQWLIYFGDFADEWARWRTCTYEGVEFVRDRLTESLRKRIGDPSLVVTIWRPREASRYELWVQVPARSLIDKIPSQVEGVSVITSVSTE